MSPDERLAAIVTRAHAMLRETDPQLAADLDGRNRAVLDLGITIGAEAALQHLTEPIHDLIARTVDWDDAIRKLQEGA